MFQQNIRKLNANFNQTLELRISRYLSTHAFQIQGGQLSWGLNETNLGDNLCHDYLNRPECLYDLGDCCQDDTFEEVEWTCYSCYCYPLDKGF